MMPEQEIDLKWKNRCSILKRHESFVKYVKSHIFDDLFCKVEEEAEITDEYFHELSRDAGEYQDIGQVHIEIKEHREMLSGLMLHIALAMLTSLYHQWEKDFRKCMSNHLESDYDSKVPIKKLLNKLNNQWNIREESCYQIIKDCESIVNTYKHNEVALNNLDKKHPEFFDKRIIEDSHEEYGWKFWEYEELSMKEDGFDKIANAFKQFWEKFPGEHP